MKFADYITNSLNEASKKLQPASPKELGQISNNDFANVDMKYIESKIDWDNVEIETQIGTPQAQGRYNDTVINATINYGKNSPWHLYFIMSGDAKVSKGWDSKAKFKGLPYPEYVELGGLGWRECAFVDSDQFRKLIFKRVKKDLKAEGIY